MRRVFAATAYHPLKASLQTLYYGQCTETQSENLRAI